jgi:hypothetical protein
MKLSTFAAAAAFVVLAGTAAAEASPYNPQDAFWKDSGSSAHRAHTTRRASRRHTHSRRSADRRHRSHRRYADSRRHRRSHTTEARRNRGHRYASASGHRVGARPRAWCGWWMRTQRGGGPEYNLAWNWRKYGRPSGPQVGAVVVWRHHVGEITGRAPNGMWIVRSGNDGNRVRERPRSVAGAIFRVAG